MTTTRFVLLLVLVIGVVTSMSSRFVQNLEDDNTLAKQGDTVERSAAFGCRAIRSASFAERIV